MHCLYCGANTSNRLFGSKVGKTFGFSLHEALFSGLWFASVVQKFLLIARILIPLPFQADIHIYVVWALWWAPSMDKWEWNNRNTLAHTFSKSKFAKPFPFNTTNCSRLLSALMVVADTIECGAAGWQWCYCVFICLHFICANGQKIRRLLCVSVSQPGFVPIHIGKW